MTVYRFNIAKEMSVPILAHFTSSNTPQNRTFSSINSNAVGCAFGRCFRFIIILIHLLSINKNYHIYCSYWHVLKSYVVLPKIRHILIYTLFVYDYVHESIEGLKAKINLFLVVIFLVRKVCAYI
jgi:hypothetical protein